MGERLAVVGGGVIGLSIAWRAAAAGWPVTLYDPAPESAASWVAGGMLAPVTESRPGEEALLDIGIAALDAWPAFAADLTQAAHDPGLRPDGTVVAAFDAADLATVRMLAEHLADRGRAVEELTGAGLRTLEPALGPSVRGGLSVPGDLAVDNRSLLCALHTAAADAGVERDLRRVDAVRPNTVRLGESTVGYDAVVIAAGAHSAALHPALTGRVFPVKGEILRLRAGARTAAAPVRTVRALVESRSVYLVPRDGGELVLGATQYEAGFDTTPTVRGVRDLLTDGERVAPGIAEYAVAEVAAGLRAGSRDGLPIVEWLEPGVLAATGHHRNGLLLAPHTATLVLTLLGVAR